MRDSENNSSWTHPRLSDPRTMSFGEHLEELRRRLIWALVSLAPLFVVALVFGEQILEFLMRPARAQLHAAGLPAVFLQTNPIELLSAWLKVSMIVTIGVGIPLIIVQAWLFVAPGLYAHERRFAKILLPLSVLMAGLGLAFLYYVMLPAMLAFLIHFGMNLGAPRVEVAPPPPGVVLPQAPILHADPPDPPPGGYWFNDRLQEFRFNAAPEGAPANVWGWPVLRLAGVVQQYKISEYVGLLFTTGLAFIVGFQTPVVVLLLGWLGIFDLRFFAKNRRYAVFLAAVAAAILAPSPDPFSMVILALPLYALYELGLVLLRYLPAERVVRGFGARRRDRSESEGEAREPVGAASGREPPDAGDE
jgi:sec-independent protein translocase protein TatC